MFTHFTYNLLLLIAALASAPYFSIRLTSSHKYREGLKQRMGWLPPGIGRANEEVRRLWVHAVSVGEALASAPLIEELKRRNAEFEVILSTVTRTGNKTAKEKIKGADHIIYFPLDFPWTVRKAIRKISPSAVVIMETEIWPNFIRQLRKMSIPSLLINGRISPCSFKGYSRVRFFMKGVLSGFSFLSMQTEEDAQRAMELGANRDAVRVTGNIKFDQSPHLAGPDQSEEYKKLFKLHDQPVFLAGSTHQGEEEAIIEAHGTLKKEFPGLRLIIAPRHPERWDRVENLISEHGYKVARRSHLLENSEAVSDDAVILLDTIGELSKIYAIATVAFVGGSLVPKGGHNVLEAASRGRVVLFGPHMFNFKEISRLLLEARGAFEVRNVKDMVEKIRWLLQNHCEREQMGLRALSVVHANQGALERNVKLVEKYLFGSKQVAE